jgi:hypothetical protein
VLTDNNRKAELSYAYLHAVAAASGFSCSYTNRHLDGCGVDAMVEINEKLDASAQLTEFYIPVQLKATSQDLTLVGDYYSWAIEVEQYDKLRTIQVSVPKLIVLLTLPIDANEWLHVTHESLMARHCARYTSVFGFPAAATPKSTTIRFAKSKVLTPQALREIARRIAIGEELP